MAKYVSQSQLTGDAGESLVGYIVSRELNAIFRPISRRDTGIDGEIELTKQIDDKFIATGIGIKVQIKASRTKTFINGKCSISLSENDIEYLTSDVNVPVVVVYCDLEATPIAYWAQISPLSLLDSKTVHFYENNILDKKCIGEFEKISSYYDYTSTCNKLSELLLMVKKRIIDVIDQSDNEEELRYVLDDFINKDMESINETHMLLISHSFKNNIVPEYDNIFNRSIEFDRSIFQAKKEFSKILQEKFGNNLDYYLK